VTSYLQLKPPVSEDQLYRLLSSHSIGNVLSVELRCSQGQVSGEIPEGSNATNAKQELFENMCHAVVIYSDPEAAENALQLNQTVELGGSRLIVLIIFHRFSPQLSDKLCRSLELYLIFRK
jgi:RNA recognition motif-containing protein